MKGLIQCVEQNIHGAWVVYGLCGIKQYYGYTKEEAVALYKKSCDIVVNQKGGKEKMLEGTMMSTGWGYVGSNKKGFEWLFTPDQKDPMYHPMSGTSECYPHCCCMSGDVFPNETTAIKDGKKWMKEAGRSGTITAVKPTPLHFEY